MGSASGAAQAEAADAAELPPLTKQQEQAAVKIQSAHRGKIARRAVANREPCQKSNLDAMKESYSIADKANFYSAVLSTVLSTVPSAACVV